MTNFLGVNSYFQADVEFERNHILLEMIPISKIVSAAILGFHFWLSQTIGLKFSDWKCTQFICVWLWRVTWTSSLEENQDRENQHDDRLGSS